jgi:predicted nucleic acid-binding protein
LILLDTNILIYAVGSEHPLRAPCRRVLSAHAEGVIRCFVTIEVIQEFAHARARRSRAEAVRLARFYTGFFRAEITGRLDLRAGLTLFEEHPNLGAFDSVLAGVALNREVEALVSADQAFGVIPHLPWVDPAGPELDLLLRRYPDPRRGHTLV